MSQISDQIVKDSKLMLLVNMAYGYQIFHFHFHLIRKENEEDQEEDKEDVGNQHVDEISLKLRVKKVVKQSSIKLPIYMQLIYRSKWCNATYIPIQTRSLILPSKVQFTPANCLNCKAKFVSSSPKQTHKKSSSRFGITKRCFFFWVLLWMEYEKL